MLGSKYDALSIVPHLRRINLSVGAYKPATLVTLRGYSR